MEEIVVETFKSIVQNDMDIEDADLEDWTARTDVILDEFKDLRNESIPWRETKE